MKCLEEQENKNVIVRKIEQYMNEIAKLRKDLNMDIPDTGYENVPLCSAEWALRYKVEEYRILYSYKLKLFEQAVPKSHFPHFTSSENQKYILAL
jgi:hypothetical protein